MMVKEYDVTLHFMYHKSINIKHIEAGCNFIHEKVEPNVVVVQFVE